MGKVLTFKNGNSITFTDTSTITELQTVVTSYAEVDSMRLEFTTYNLSDVTFDSIRYTNIIPVSSTATANAEGNITVRFINEYKASEEVQKLKEQIAELEAENAELANENEQLTDKAEAADILLGNTQPNTEEVK